MELPINVIKLPPTQPLCNANVGPVMRTSQILTDLLAPLANARNNTKECDSTKDMLRAVRDANKELELEEKNGELNFIEKLMVFSQDVTALYPSIKLRHY